MTKDPLQSLRLAGERLASVIPARVAAAAGAPGALDDDAATAAMSAAAGAFDLGARLTPEGGARGPEMRGAAALRTAWSLRLESSLHVVEEALASAGARAVLIKGAAVRHLDPRLAGRTYWDIDLVLAHGDVSRVRDALAGRGFTYRRMPWEPRVGSGLRAEHAFQMASDDGVSLDLHRSVPPERWGARLDAAALAAASAPRSAHLVDAGGVHAALIAALSVVHDLGEGLQAWRDCLVLLGDAAASSGWVEEAVRLGMATPLAAVASGLQRFTGGEHPALEALAPHVDVRDVRILHRMLDARDGDHRRVARMLGMTGWRAARYGLECLWPDRTYLAIHVPGSRLPRAVRLGRTLRTALRLGGTRRPHDSNRNGT